MLKFKIYNLLLLLLIFFVSCKTKQLQTDTINNNLPKKYSDSVSNTSSSNLKWKEFYFDPNLVKLIDTALKNNFDLKIALQKIEMNRAALKTNKGIRLPELGVNAAIGQRKFGEYTMDGVGNYDTQFSTNINNKQHIPNPLPDYNVGFQASWEIDLWGKLKNKKKSAASKFIASQYGKDLIITNLIAEIATAYYELIAYDEEVQILKENIELQNNAIEMVLAQKEAGKANELAIELMTAQLLNSKTIKAEIEQLTIETISNINFLCGAYPYNLNRDTNFLAQKINNTIAIGVPSNLINNRADIKQAEFELNAANADIKSAKAAFYPSLNINALIGLQSFNALLLTELPASLAYNTIGGLTAPLLNRRKLKGELMAAESEQKQAYINYERNVVNAFKEVYVAINNIKNTKVMYDLKKEEVDLLKKSISTSSELFRAGRANYLEIITSQKNSLHSQIELINFFKRQNIALINLYKALGGGWK
jgi:multidrug efflux system outer membrane protein